MAIDPSIALNIRPVQLESPVNMLAQALRVKGMQQEAQLGQAKLAEYERGKNRQNAMQSLLQSLKPNTTDDQRVGALRGGGFFDEADQIEKGIGERRKVESEAGEREWKVKKDKLTFAGQAFGGVMKNPSLENALGTLDYLGQNGILPPELVEQYRGVVQTNPAQIGMLAEQAYRSVLEADKQLMTASTRNLGGTTQTLGVDPVTGKASVLSTAANTMTPGEAGRIAVERERLAWDKTQPKGQVVQTETGPILVDPRTGVGAPVTVGGKPVQSKELIQRTQDAKSVIDLLDLAEPLLDTATSSLVGAGYDRAAAAFGKSTEGAQAASQLKALEGALISKMPKMTGPQSDKDVLLYRQMAGQIGDATLPTETRRASMKTIRDLHAKYADPQAPAAPKARKFNPATGRIE